jgi:hypothetical protein
MGGIVVVGSVACMVYRLDVVILDIKILRTRGPVKAKVTYRQANA